MRTFSFLFLFTTISLNAQVDSSSVVDANRQVLNTKAGMITFEKPTVWQMFSYVPDDLCKFARFTVQKENFGWDAAVAASTAALIATDQSLLDEADRVGKKMGGGWSTDSHYRKFLGLNIVPENLSSGVYYIGNGGTTVLLSGIFFGIGKIRHNDYRALNTSSELLECLFSVGIATQTVKHITGRQSPVRAIDERNPGGDWQPFPSISAYQKNTPNYDAMPSGHIATYIATLTVIATNYPEIKWIRPVGYSLMALLAFNMVSTKVHWVSDYPLGLFMGYVIGKTIAERRIIRPRKDPVGECTPKYKIRYNINFAENTSLYGLSLTF
ncbi:MAG: phosphatase PAP2 family protein [Flavobacterium sp.]|nr:MAG: phosphatase PAP2 family protein [Flavobacterium sp.]